MRKMFLVVPVCALGLCLASCISMHKSGGKEEGEGAEGNEMKMSFNQIPAAAQKTLSEEAKGNKIDTVDKESKHGKTIYEADVMIGGTNYEICVDEAGQLVSKKIDNEAGGKGRSEKKGGKGEDEKKEKKEKKRCPRRGRGAVIVGKKGMCVGGVLLGVAGADGGGL